MPEITDPLGMLETAMDALCAADPARFSDRDSIKEIYRQFSRFEAVTTRATAAFDAQRDWEEDRARTAAGWLSATTHVPKTLAQRRVWLGRQLRTMDLVEKAWLAGDMGEAQAGLLARARTPGRADTFIRDEELLVSQACRLRYGHFRRALAYWCYRADPAESEAEADDDYQARQLHFSDGLRGTKLLNGTFDPIGGAIVGDELSRIEQELFDADWAEARERLGPEACAADLARSAAQRRADALVEMARRLFTGATRRAVALRDRECFHPFCDVPATDCQIDHIEPFAAGGLTTQDNGRPACGPHNRDRHRRT